MNGTRKKDAMILTELARQLDQTRLRTHLVIDASPAALHVANGDHLGPDGQELLAGDLHVFRDGGANDLLRWSAGDILGPVHELGRAGAKICASLLIDDGDDSMRRPGPPATSTPSRGGLLTQRKSSYGLGHRRAAQRLLMLATMTAMASSDTRVADSRHKPSENRSRPFHTD